MLETTSRPERRVKIRASLVLFSVSSRPKPCLENSVAAPATSLNADPVFFATSNNWSPNFLIPEEDVFNTTLMSVRAFSTSIVEATNAVKDF